MSSTWGGDSSPERLFACIIMIIFHILEDFGRFTRTLRSPEQQEHTSSLRHAQSGSFRNNPWKGQSECSLFSFWSFAILIAKQHPKRLTCSCDLTASSSETGENTATACCYCELRLKGRKIFREGRGGNETEKKFVMFVQQVRRWIARDLAAFWNTEDTTRQQLRNRNWGRWRKVNFCTVTP